MSDDNKSYNSFLQKLIKSLQLVVDTPTPIDSPLEEEVVIKSYNESEEGVLLESVVEERRCLEVVMEPMKRDAHDQWYTPETIAKGYASYERNKENIPSNLFHITKTNTFEIESTFLLEEDTYYESIDDTLVKGTWMAWSKYTDDDVWELKKSKKLGGLSPACLGSVDKDTGEITNLAFTKEEFFANQEVQE